MVRCLQTTSRRRPMSRAVRFDKYGGIDVLRVVEVDRPAPGPSQVLVRIKAAGINPGEAAIREGAFANRWPSTFPSGQGSDLAGLVEQVGSAVKTVAVGDEIIGFTDNRARPGMSAPRSLVSPALRITPGSP